MSGHSKFSKIFQNEEGKEKYFIYTGETCSKVNLFQLINLKGETSICYRLITHKARYYKPFFVDYGLQFLKTPNLKSHN